MDRLYWGIQLPANGKDNVILMARTTLAWVDRRLATDFSDVMPDDSALFVTIMIYEHVRSAFLLDRLLYDSKDMKETANQIF